MTKYLGWKIAGIVALAGASAYFLFEYFKNPNKKIKKPDKNAPLTYNPITVFNAARTGYTELSDLQALNVAERIYRIETANFTSNIYKHTYGAGIVAFSETYPYSWSGLKTLWDLDNVKSCGLYNSVNGLDYVIFPSLISGIESVVQILKNNMAAGYLPATHYSPTTQGYVQSLIDIPDNQLITTSYTNNPFLK